MASSFNKVTWITSDGKYVSVTLNVLQCSLTASHSTHIWVIGLPDGAWASDVSLHDARFCRGLK